MVGNEDEFHGGSFAIPRVTLRALAGNSISHFSLADAERECSRRATPADKDGKQGRQSEVPHSIGIRGALGDHRKSKKEEITLTN
jgi:hypothetical protein